MSQVGQQNPRRIGYDGRAVVVDGRRALVVGGSVHYPRSTPLLWPDLFRRSRAAGLTAIDTYVFWNLHERRRGVYDFSDRLDLVGFLRLAGEHGLDVVLRVGPYICAETNFGGFPAWLRDVPDVQLRTDNEPYKAEVCRWLKFLGDLVRPLTAPRGGPIILAQIENEYGLVAGQYGEAGKRYLDWCVGRAEAMDLGVPWVTCVGGAPGTVETINGFYAHEALPKHFAERPGQPALWTEHWPGWHDVWGYPHRTRPAENAAYATARFFAAGGAGVNYYMWHGGTNFGRDGMFLQATSYDFDAPLDEYGLETTKSRHLAKLHAVLHRHADMLLNAPRPEPTPLGEHTRAFAWGEGDGAVAFLCNDHPTEAAAVTFDGQSHELPPRSAKILHNGAVEFDSAKVDAEIVVRRTMDPVEGALSAFEMWRENVPATWPVGVRSRLVGEGPVDQLRLTRDETDYCWYTTWLDVPEEGGTRTRLTIEGMADVVYVFVDGRLRTFHHALVEDRGPQDGPPFNWSFPLRVPPGDHELQILCGAVGLIKGDWMLGNRNMAEEKKGLWGRVLWDGRPLAGPWYMIPGLLGERYQLFGPAGELANWKPAAGSAHGPLSWFRARFEGPPGDEPVAVDLTGLNKGMAWLNGRCVGRYWLSPANNKSPDWLGQAIREAPPGQPTQRYYHLPAEWLAARNTLVLFEELGGSTDAVRLCRWG